ncbi:helix-turn-helix domain-containing protein [Legionella gresilensis]|uniref:helix-turn-helix domain-containing protein n=1 Tax=Legionella gresilensis TaxID=91823 RepID=UPI00104181C8|nr:helix-turn-helix domain-containing protein [Legionella gresilensis]
MPKNNPSTQMPRNSCLTIQEAADILNISIPYFKKLLEEGKIPFDKVNNRILVTDLNKFKDRSLAERKAILQELVDQAQSLDMGY